MARKRREPLAHGWLVLDKPLGMTSTQAVGKVRHAFGNTKAGHGGTLDPLATGVLPIALGEATKTVPYVMDGRKVYRFTVRWGEARSTDDCEGDVTATSDVRPAPDAILAALPAFTGTISQVPPRFSAVKINGERAYALARAGHDVEIRARQVRIDAFRLIDTPGADETAFEIECGKGTYVRSLARDLAVALGTVGHVSALRRTRVGPFTLDHAIELDLATGFGHGAPAIEAVLPVETALDDIPALAISGSEAEGLRQGRPLALFRKGDLDRIGRLTEGDVVRAECGGKTVALGRFGEGRIKPVRVFNI